MIKKIRLCLLISVLFLYPSLPSFAMDNDMFDDLISSKNGSFSVRVNPGKHHDTLLISCIECRLRKEISQFMDSVNLENKFYEIALPGASLSISGDPKGPSNKTVMNVISLINDNEFKRIIMIDHSDCAAYKKFPSRFPEEFSLAENDFDNFRLNPSSSIKNIELEMAIHKNQLKKAKEIISGEIGNKKIYKFFYKFNPKDKLDDKGEIDGNIISIDYQETQSINILTGSSSKQHSSNENPTTTGQKTILDYFNSETGEHVNAEDWSPKAEITYKLNEIKDK